MSNSAVVQLCFEHHVVEVELPEEVADLLCAADGWPTFPQFPARLRIITTRPSGCGATVSYAMEANGGYDINQEENEHDS